MLSKQQWNAKNYTQLKFSIAPTLADAFKIACNAANVSMTSVVVEFMTKYLKLAAAKRSDFKYKTKKQRRDAIKRIIQSLESIKNAQEHSRDNIPENLQGSTYFEEAIELLTNIY